MKQNEEEKAALETEEDWKADLAVVNASGVLPCSEDLKPAALQASTLGLTQTAMTCPNCGSALEGRKCKLFCHRPGCGYMVTCSEW
jgi:hypothetical protein